MNRVLGAVDQRPEGTDLFGAIIKLRESAQD
jgi:hypothetical protein